MSPSRRSPPVPDALVVELPELVVSAGAGGARLTIRLLRPTTLTLQSGRWRIVHDPVGLTGDRLLANVHQAVAGQWRAESETAGDTASATAAGVGPGRAIRWVLTRPPMRLVCAATDELATRAWQAVPSARGARRVAETVVHAAAAGGHTRRSAEPPAPPLGRTTGSVRERGRFAGVLLLSESTGADAVSPTAAARLVLRAVRQGWSVLASTRDAPVTVGLDTVGADASGEDGMGGSAIGGDTIGGDARGSQVVSPPPTPPWRSHWMCERGVLVPCPPALD